MKKWFGLFATQFLGVFNDNLLKFLAIFICLNWIGDDYRSTMTSLATALLVIPFLLFSPWAGWLSKVKYKVQILRFLKLMELPIMLVAIVGFYIGFQGYHTASIVILLFSIVLMGFQSCIYSPAKYGLIRDVDGEDGISFGTGMMEMLSFVAVLTGTYLASRLAIVDNKLTVMGFALIGVAILGYFTSRTINVKESLPNVRAQKSINPIKFISANYQFAQKVEGLNFVVLGLSFFWVIAALIQMNMVVYIEDVYGLKEIQTGNAMVVAAIGIGAGCWFSGNISKRVDYSLTIFGAIGLAISSFVIYVSSFSLTTFYIMIFITSFFAGVYKVPLNGFIQQNVKGRKLGDIIAYNNLITFLFMIVGTGFNILVERLFSSNAIFLLCSILSILICFLLIFKVPNILIDYFSKMFYIFSLMLYNIKVEGKEKARNITGTLIVSNHISLLDSIILMRPMRKYFSFVIDSDFFKIKPLRWLFTKTRMIPISPRWRSNLLEKFYQQCNEVLKDDNNLCIFPEGELNRIGNLSTFKKGYEEITAKNNAPILPMYMDNALGTHFTQPVGLTKSSWFKPRIKKQRIHIKVGELLPPQTPAFVLRQKLKELESDIFTHRFSKKSNFLRTAKSNLSKLQFKFSSNSTYSGNKLWVDARRIARNIHSKIKSENLIAINTDNPKQLIQYMFALMRLNKSWINLSNFSAHEIEKLAKSYTISYQLGEKKTSRLQIIDETDASAKISVLNVNKLSRQIRKKHSFAIFPVFDHDHFEIYELNHEYLLSTMEALKQQFSVDKKDVVYACSINTAEEFLLNLAFPIYMKLNVNLYPSPENTITIFNSDIQNLDSYKYVFADPSIEESENRYKYLSIPGLLPLVSLNAPDYVGLSAAGTQTKQIARKPDSLGRAMPGTAIRLVDAQGVEVNSNEVGFIEIKHNAITHMHSYTGNLWYGTKLKAAIGEEGFVFMK